MKTLKTLTAPLEIQGVQFGVRLVRRGVKDNHICVQLRSEDDERWFDVGDAFSSAWLDDLITQLTMCKTLLESHAVKNGEFGYNFSEEPENS